LIGYIFVCTSVIGAIKTRRWCSKKVVDGFGKRLYFLALQWSIEARDLRKIKL
jgi:hypothetical protein